MKRLITHFAKSVLGSGSRWISKREYRLQRFIRHNERPVEFGFVFRKISEIYPKTVLDVGTGTTALPHLIRNCGCIVTAIDNIRDYWAGGMQNRHFHVIDDDITATKITNTFDLITCISVLEHIEDSQSAVRNMISLLKPNGYLIVTMPYTEDEYIKNVYDLAGSSYGQDASYITQSYSRANLNQWFLDSEAQIIQQEYWEFWTGDHWTVGNQILPPKLVTKNDKHQLTCILVQKR